MKQILMSVRPEYLIKTLNGEKTAELRTRFPIDFNGIVNLYCTLSYPLITSWEGKYYQVPNIDHPYETLNGKVVARFRVSECIKLHYDYEYERNDGYYWKNTVISSSQLVKKTCLHEVDIAHYGGYGKPLYAILINDLEIFDTPKDLSDFKNAKGEPLTKAPQSWQYVYERKE